MKRRAIDNMQPWAKWAVRNRMTFVLLAFQWVVLFPVAIIFEGLVQVAKMVNELCRQNAEISGNIRKASREAREEKE